MTVADTSTLGLNKIAIGDIPHVMKRLGGHVERRTGGHNYDVYAFPGSDKKVHAPPVAHRQKTRPIGNGHLTSIVQGLIEVGIPKIFIAHAFDMEGGVWYQPPERAPHIQKLLKEEREHVERGEWGTLNLLAASMQPTDDEKETSVPEEKTKPKPEIVWSGLSMDDAVRLGLPEDVTPQFVTNTKKQLGQRIGKGEKEPWATLLASGEIVRTPSKDRRGPRYTYRLSEGAASRVAEFAQERYERYHGKPKARKPLPAPETKEEARAQMKDAVQRHKPALDKLQELDGGGESISAGPSIPKEKVTPAKIAPRPAREVRLRKGFGPALSALVQRFGVDLTFDEDFSVDVKRFIEDLELATRPEDG